MMTVLREGMIMSLTLGAALDDATPEQRAQLHALLKPGNSVAMDLYSMTGDTAPIYEIIQRIMGPAWVPAGDYARQIQELRGE